MIHDHGAASAPLGRTKDRTPRVRRLLSEPLVQFLALGALLFLVFHWRGGGGPSSRRIVVTPGQVDTLVAGFTRTWQRPPSADEIRALLDEHVREEIAVREAMAAGLDRDDTVIRRRLRQKWEFVEEDGLDVAPPTDAELQEWLDAHADAYRVEPRIAFRQVVLTADRRGASLEADARALLEELAAAGPDADIEALGDLRSLPSDVDLAPLGDVARSFGDELARALVDVEAGRWAGPVESGYGLHVVFVREREQGRAPALGDVRADVERDVLADRRERQMKARYAELRARYEVLVEERPAPPGPPK